MRKMVVLSMLCFAVSCTETINPSFYGNAEKYISNPGDLALCARQQGLEPPFTYKPHYNRDTDAMTFVMTKAVNASAQRFAAAQTCAEDRYQARGRTDFPETTVAECQAVYDIFASKDSDVIYPMQPTGTNLLAAIFVSVAADGISQSAHLKNYQKCMTRVIGHGNVQPLRARGQPTDATAANPNTAAVAAGTETPTETQLGYMSPQAASVISGVNPECFAGTSLFTGGAGLCPQ